MVHPLPASSTLGDGIGVLHAYRLLMQRSNFRVYTRDQSMSPHMQHMLHSATAQVLYQCALNPWLCPDGILARIAVNDTNVYRPTNWVIATYWLKALRLQVRLQADPRYTYSLQVNVRYTWVKQRVSNGTAGRYRRKYVEPRLLDYNDIVRELDTLKINDRRAVPGRLQADIRSMFGRFSGLLHQVYKQS